MHDAVADVLAQRRAIDRGGAGAVLLSLLLHVSMTAAAVYTALHRPPPQRIVPIDIRLARPAQQTAPVVPAPAVEKPKPPTPRIEPPKPEPIKPAPAVKPPEKNTAPMSPFGRSNKKGSDNPPPPTPAPAATATAADVAVGQAGVTGLEGGDFPYTAYIERMKTLIGNNWLRPEITDQRTTIVYFEIDRNGRILKAETEVGSGNRLFDRVALSAVRQASPLPPLPPSYSGTYLGVHLTFR